MITPRNPVILDSRWRANPLANQCPRRASMILTSNQPFSRWGEIFGDDVAAAIIDRRVRHAEILNLKGDCDRLKDKGSRLPAARQGPPKSGERFRPAALRRSRHVARHVADQP
jgi:hypothetical protein